MRNIFGPCQACFEGKATMPSPQAGATITTAPGQLLHADLKEYAATTIGGNRWALVTVDDYTGFIQVVSIKNKSTASVLAGLKCVIRFYNQFRHVVVAIQVDPEKTLLACQPGLSEIGIKLDDMIPGTHERLVERSIRTLYERLRTVLADQPYKLPEKLHGEALQYCVDSINSVPNNKTLTRTHTGNRYR
jgi:hypothetical protein